MKFRTALVITILLPFTLVFNSCTPLYIPNVVNTPLLSNKGEFEAAMNGGISFQAGIIPTIISDPQFAYAVTDNVGVMLNGSFSGMKSSDPAIKDFTHRFLEAGVGYYDPFAKNGRVEIFGGYGAGEIHGYFENEFFKGNGSSRVNRFFIQPDIGFSSDLIDLSMAWRVSLVNIELTDSLSRKYSRGAFEPFFEPAVNLKLGYKFLKIILQTGFSFPLNKMTYHENGNINSYFSYMMSFGLQLDLFKTKYQPKIKMYSGATETIQQ
ncbi:MAG: hypothetical protein NTW49_07920 [Bacteroidia bacterium]|nr:hypothetical protein [Bacteroidia bacterium]